jgi:hypothetical protein
MALAPELRNAIILSGGKEVDDQIRCSRTLVSFSSVRGARLLSKISLPPCLTGRPCHELLRFVERGCDAVAALVQADETAFGAPLGGRRHARLDRWAHGPQSQASAVDCEPLFRNIHGSHGCASPTSIEDLAEPRRRLSPTGVDRTAGRAGMNALSRPSATS